MDNQTAPLLTNFHDNHILQIGDACVWLRSTMAGENSVDIDKH